MFISEIKLKIKNKTPLKIGSGSDEFDLLIDKNNNFFIPASSIKGSFRNYLKNEKNLEKFFGGQNVESKIYFFDTFSTKSNLVSRNGIRIDEKFSVAKKGALYEMNFLEEGAVFEVLFKVFSDTKEELNEAKNLLYKALGGLKSEEIRFGSNKTSGFGSFLVEEVKERNFDLKSDLESYVLNTKNFENIKIEKFESENYEIIKFVGSVKDSLIIKNGSESIKNSSGEYVIYGSTLKGMLRGYTQKIVNTLNKDKDFVDNLFGNEEISGKVFLSDAKLTNVSEVVYNRIKIDRFTGGAISGALMNEKRIDCDLSFEIKFKKTDDEIFNKKSMALILLTLRDLGAGEVLIGSSKSIGSGRILGENIYLNEKELITFNKEKFTVKNKSYIDSVMKSLVGGA